MKYRFRYLQNVLNIFENKKKLVSFFILTKKKYNTAGLGETNWEKCFQNIKNGDIDTKY